METNEVKKQGGRLSSISALVRRFRRIFIVAVAVAVVGIIAFVFLHRMWGGAGESGTNMGVFTVERGPLIIRDTVSGDIKALNSVDIKSEVEGRTTIISIVPEGTVITPEDVNNGKILFELDSSEIKQRLTQQEISFLAAQANLTEARESLDIQLKQNESDIMASHMKVRFALMDLQKYLGADLAEKLVSHADSNLNGDPNNDAGNVEKENNRIVSLIDDPNLGGEASQKLKELRSSILLAEENFKQASNRLDWTRKLEEKKYVSKTQMEEDELAVQRLEIEKGKGEIALDLFKAYEFPKQAEKLLSDYQEAGRQLGRTEAQARSKLAQAQAKLRSNEATYSLQQENLLKLQKQFAACKIKAPAPGQVVYSSSMMNSWERQRGQIEVGAEVRERQKIISIPDPCAMKAEVKIHETWVDKVQPGQQVKITMSAFPDKVFTGKVLKKAPLASPEEWMNPDLKVYAADVSIDGTHDFLKTGMTAKVEIIIEELKDVLSVPIQAVVNRGGKKLCYVENSKNPREREVETGAFNDSFVEIKKGLSEGDKVLLNPPRIAEPQQAPNKEVKNPVENTDQKP
ncbi:MAG: efflux RND transporter periplasmic adaptor subunit [Planctomycetota bacterium]|nr:efflux RND transporter periplasmic adaptor subunit [Planctomycetota bacterium]